MDALEAIFTRQSISKVRPDPPPREVIEKLLAAAVQAPNHFHVRPWRFVVIGGEARHRLGDAMAQALKQRVPETLDQALEVERARPLRAPILIAVAADLPVTPREVALENICAAAAAAENLLLAAHSLGLAAMWRTGGAAAEAGVKTFLGLDPAQPLVGFIYLGYAAAEQTPVQRPSFEDRTTWME